jgi:hypothetical protein
MFEKEERIPFKAFSGLPCKAPTGNDMKSVRGVTTFRPDNTISMISVTFYENEEYP